MKVAFADGYFEALIKLTPNEQNLANQAVLKLQNDHGQSGLNYEKLSVCKDGSMRSVRVNRDVRIILCTTDTAGLVILLYVDHHDDAYSWAEKRKVELNPYTQAIQVYQVAEQVISPAEAAPAPEQPSGAFGELKDKQLLRLGVPESSIPVVRDIYIEADLDDALGKSFIDQQTHDGLFMFIAGGTYEDAVLEVMAVESLEEAEATPKSVTLEEAINSPINMAHFAVSENEAELQEVLEQSIQKWRIFLHPTQRRWAEGTKNGPVRVLGGAGTGKTVVAMHRARWLAQHIATAEKKVLFTTFTKNLAADIQQNLQGLCNPDEMKLIEVVNLDSWVMSFLRQSGYDYQLLMNSKLEGQFWSQAMGEKPASSSLGEAFFRDEWQFVIQPQSIGSVEEYKKASRVGRGTRLNRSNRVELWPVFQEYRLLLSRNNFKETDDAYRDAANLIEQDIDTRPSYSGIIVDEAQDMGTQAFKLVRSMIEEGQNDIFVVGDGHQRIYGKNKVVLGRCGVNIRGRSARLKINYRTTDETRKTAVGILDGVKVDDLDGGEDTQIGYRSLMHGPEPQIMTFGSFSEQSKAIVDFLESNELALEGSCVVARTNKEVDFIASELEELGISTLKIDGRAGHTEKTGKLNIATMHRVKGLEFDYVFLASANGGLVPLDYVLDTAGDDVTRRQKEDEERALVYVTLTRARKQAFVYSYGSLGKFFS
tara:strand:- start:8715 stop:10838 length:2124 start_codon:yes stop_codon:yes gene_type:complete